MTQLRDMLIRHEGVRLKPYRDTVGKLTIGVGRNLDDVGISQDEADLMLDNDINRSHDACASAFPWFAALDSVRQDVLIDMAFNLGLEALKGFHMTLGCIEKGDYEGAARNMLLSRWRDEVGQRAVELSNLMRTGSY